MGDHSGDDRGQDLVSKVVLRSHPGDTGSKSTVNGGSEPSDSNFNQISSLSHTDTKYRGKRQEHKSVNHMLNKITGIYMDWEEPPELTLCSPLGFRNMWAF